MKAAARRHTRNVRLKDTFPYHLMLLPGMLVLLVYTIIPFFGNIIAFQNFVPVKGFVKSQFVGLVNFKRVFTMPDTFRVFSNTLLIACGKLIFGLIMGIFFAILLNEARGRFFKKSVQTVAFLPHFLSWVILATVFRDILDPTGILNLILQKAGIIAKPILFLGSNSWFQGMMIGSDVWKEFGYGAVIFIAALTAINPELYEAAEMDGIGRIGRIVHITLPGIAVTIVLVATLNLGSILNANFDQVYNLYSPVVYKTGDIIDTYVYRMSFLNAQYSFAAAVGLLKSLLSFILIITANLLAGKFAKYRIF